MLIGRYLSFTAEHLLSVCANAARQAEGITEDGYSRSYRLPPLSRQGGGQALHGVQQGTGYNDGLKRVAASIMGRALPADNDLLRIHVLWASGSAEGARVAALISDHFDGLGMERDGVAIRIPVRFASAPWEDGSPLPREIDLTRAEHNVIVLLHDGYLHEDAAEWDRYVAGLRAAMDARAAADLYVPFGSPQRDPQLPGDVARHTQYARRDNWAANLTGAAMDARLLLHLVHSMREHLRELAGCGDVPEKLFVSHAKADGDSTAWSIVEYVNQKQQDVPLDTFYDAKELQPGDDYERVFEEQIGRGTLLAIVSDVYDSRPWCVYELTTAKRARRPIVLADVGKVRTSRTFPYGANLPKIRVNPDGAGTLWIEQLLVQTVSEGLRCDIFTAQAKRRIATAGIADALVLPRPPELFDLLPAGTADHIIVYPDPPVGRLEAEILNAAAAGLGRTITFSALSEVGAA